MLEINQDAVKTLGVALDLLFKCCLRICPGNGLELAPRSRLTGKKKCLRILAVAAEFE